MNKYVRWAIRLIGPALLVLFLWRSDFSQLAAGFSRIQIVPLLLSLLLFFPFVAIKAWRWNALMAELGMHPPTLRFSMALYMIGLYLGGTTPGQSGDFIKAWYLRERGEALAPALFSIVLDRLFDFLIMALLALLALVAFLDILPRSAQIATIAFAVVVFLTTPSLMARGPREWLFARLLPITPQRLRAPLERWREQFSQLSLRPGPAAKLLLASVTSAASTMLRIYLLFLALQLGNVPLLAIISSTALIAILQALPISFSGIGVRDAILIAVLARYGYTAELALILSALFLLLNIEHMLIGFLVSLRYPLGAQPDASLSGEPREPAASG
ncbi:MAG: lysylphosphatidylglycerol synthase transmembrane domain-containing protein [Kouleothrix sp.]